MLAGMGNTSSHHNSPSCLVPPITTLCSELICSSQFFLPFLTNENPPQLSPTITGEPTRCATIWQKQAKKQTESFVVHLRKMEKEKSREQSLSSQRLLHEQVRKQKRQRVMKGNTS